MKTTEVKIYVLYDPRDCKVRYIGRTTKKVLKHRLIEHISKARYESVYYPGKKSSHKNNWIKSLLNNNIEPQIKLLTKVNGWKESHVVEKCLINKHCISKNLVNANDKGIGGLNQIVEKETKEKISSSLKQFYKTNLNSCAKAIEVYDLEGNFIESYASATEFAKKLNVNARQVTRIASGGPGRRQIKGFQIKYSDSEKIISKFEYKKKAKYESFKKRKIIILENLETGKKTQHLGISELLKSLSIPRHLYSNRKQKSSVVIIGNYKFIPGPE
jgi:hypothetical protein